MAYVFGIKLDIPEIDSLDKRSQKAVIREIRKQCKGARDAITMLNLAQLAWTFACCFTSGFFVEWLPAVITFVEGEMLTLLNCGGFIILWLLGDHLIQRRMKKKAEAGIARFFEEHWPQGRPRLCLKCGYDLRVLTTDHCPECGTMVPQRTPVKPPPLPPNRDVLL